MSYRPLLIAPCLCEGSSAIFFLPKEEVEVQVPRSFLRLLIRLCDGTREVEAIVRSLSTTWDETQARVAIEQLTERGVLVDSRNISGHVWEFIKNPSPWNHPLTQDQIHELVLDQRHQKMPRSRRASFKVHETPWTRFLATRSSQRIFGDQSVPEDAIIRMLWSAYGKTTTVLDEEGRSLVYRRTVPSAGALYPLRIYLAVFCASGSIKPGIYRVSDDPKLIHLHKISSHYELARSAFIQREVIATAHGAVIICGAFARSAAKYANRAMMYTVLEAGHVAQNAISSAMYDHIATLEAGGFTEKELSAALHLEAGINPLVTVVYGSPYTSPPKGRAPQPHHDRTNIVSELQIIPAQAGGFRVPFHMVFGKVISDAGAQTWWSCGRSQDLALAKTKATAEGIEWFASSRGNECDFTVDSLNHLGGVAIDPRIMHPYLDAQISATKYVTPFDPNAKYQWCWAEDVTTGKRRLVLADFVYYPFEPSSKRRYAYANSSGAAAHRTVELAYERALLELVERDAFMVSWFNRQQLPSISERSLPTEIRQRLKNLRAHGFTTSVLNMTYDLAPVIFVGALNESMPYFTCSAAADFDPVQALDRALMEVEGSIYCRFRDGQTKRVLRPEEAWEVHDRDLLYQQRRSINRARFLLRGSDRSITIGAVVRQIGAKSVGELVADLGQKGYPCLRVNLSQNDPILRGQPLTVIKAFVPGLVPLVFEYGLDAIGLERSRMLPVWCGYAQRPLPTARLNTYPHPYT